MDKEFENYLITELKLSQNTAMSYLSDIKQFKKYYFDSYGEELIKLLAPDIKMYTSYLLNRENRKPTTINRILSSLKNYNDFLIYKGIQSNCVITKKDYIKIQPFYGRNDIPSDKIVFKIIHSAINNKRDYCILVIAAFGGLRESEIVHIKLTDIHLEERFIQILGKGNKFRSVVINDVMYNAIKDYLEERKNNNINSIYLFVGKKSNYYKNQPLNRNSINRILDKYCKKLDLQGLHPHLLRGFFCTNSYYKAGYSLVQVSSQAGHSSIEMTRRYIDSKENDIYKLANKMY